MGTYIDMLGDVIIAEFVDIRSRSDEYEPLDQYKANFSTCTVKF